MITAPTPESDSIYAQSGRSATGRLLAGRLRLAANGIPMYINDSGRPTPETAQIVSGCKQTSDIN